MKCPRCGNELRRSKKDPSYGLCDTCRKKIKWVEDIPDDEYDDYDDYDDYDRKPRRNRKPQKRRASESGRFQTWKLISGILSIILFVFVSFQSCAAGASNALSENGEISGSAGLLVAVMLLAGGIVSIVTRKGGKGGNIAIIVLYGIGALTGFTLAGSFSDLTIWAAWCAICVLFGVLSLVLKGKR